ncbi:MAG: hypothetical protein ACJAZO_000161 [Myxococcota bacterium]|jgi:hypothetical protein
MKRFAIVAAMFAAACGYSEDKFAEETAEATCAVTVTCFESHADVDACLAEGDDVEETDDAECINFDSAAAQDCVEGLEALETTCPEDILDFFAQFPADCGNVCDLEADTGMDTDTDSGTAAM